MLQVIAELVVVMTRVLQTRLQQWKLVGDPRENDAVFESDLYGFPHQSAKFTPVVIEYGQRRAVLLAFLELACSVILQTAADVKHAWIAAGSLLSIGMHEFFCVLTC